jgi:hypothetical protein
LSRRVLLVFWEADAGVAAVRGLDLAVSLPCLEVADGGFLLSEVSGTGR